ncbi:MAG: cyclic nucleotide-binding domain-containing protein [Desulfobacterales bacterium]|nr:cyclic nucleotide-binding domain-containing protein [Desulfobacterales bacterium]
MLKSLGKWLKIYEDEIGLFLWAATILFLIRSSNILFNNFAETTFLKRFGVEYLPIVYMINSISTFFIMGVITGIMGRLPGARLLTYMLMFCGISVAGLRFVIPLDFDLLYPVLFVLKTQYEVLLGLVFWNLANDLFNTRQSKRLFPLITAGGVLGGIIGSFGTPSLVKAVSLNNLMLVYLVTTMIGAIAVKRMGTLFPTLLLSEKKDKKAGSRFAIIEEFKKVLPMIRESMLVKILIMLTLLPNVVIPIINYQFNFAIDRTFASESGMVNFFGYFRGVLNVISLIILLFVGRIYSRWGLPVALMFHPFNYMFAFMALLLKFDIFSAMYARISTNVLRTTINNPARAVLVGLVPSVYRAVLRPFLRGTIVRIGVLTGSCAIMISEGFLHPRYLSIAACICVCAWIATTFILKREYPKILFNLISRNVIDLKSMEETDVSQVFKGEEARSQLIQLFLSSQGTDCLWYARLLKLLKTKGLDEHILFAIKNNKDDKTKIGLLKMLSPDAGKAAVQVFMELADPDNPELMVAFARTAKRVYADMPVDFQQEIFNSAQNPEVKAYAMIGLYQDTPHEYRGVIDAWLDSNHLPERRAGILVAGESEDPAYIEKLEDMLKREEDESIIPLILEALHRLKAPEMNSISLPYLDHASKMVRLAGLSVLEITDDDVAGKVISLMGDNDEQVRSSAIEKIEGSDYQNPQLLLESLIIPKRKVREGIFDLLESLDIKDLDVFRFARSRLEIAYVCLAEAEALKTFSKSREKNLLQDHLEQMMRRQLENIIRVLATQDRSGQMKMIWRGISSADDRQRANSLEALDNAMDASLSKILMPLLENLSRSESLAVGGKNFHLPDFNSKKAIYSHLLNKQDWVTAVLTLYLIANQGLEGLDKGDIQRLADSENIHIRQMGQFAIERQISDPVKLEDAMEAELTIPDKILRLKGIHIFEGLSLSELAAVASVTEERVFPPAQLVIREGEPGETMYLIIEGEVSVIKGHGGGNEVELDRTGAGDYFGEMALFEDVVRSATIRTEQETRLLVLHKQEFTEIVREYPGIALQICKALSQRIRKLHDKVEIKR